MTKSSSNFLRYLLLSTGATGVLCTPIRACASGMSRAENYGWMAFFLGMGLFFCLLGVSCLGSALLLLQFVSKKRSAKSSKWAKGLGVISIALAVVGTVANQRFPAWPLQPLCMLSLAGMGIMDLLLAVKLAPR